jgi:hypothetical protein
MIQRSFTFNHNSSLGGVNSYKRSNGVNPSLCQVSIQIQHFLAMETCNQLHKPNVSIETLMFHKS